MTAETMKAEMIADEVMIMNGYHETPDIEVGADDWSYQQDVLRQMAAEDAAERKWAMMQPGDYPEIVW